MATVTALDISATWLAVRLQLGAALVQIKVAVIGSIQEIFILVAFGLQDTVSKSAGDRDHGQP
jgi:hypothetical protein